MLKNDAQAAIVIEHAWKRGILGWKLDTLQSDISRVLSNDKIKKACILSSRQIGKSYWSCVYALEFLLTNPGKIARIVAPTLEQCHNIVNDNLGSILEDVPQGLIERKKSDLRWDLQNGSSLRLGALKRAHVDSNRGGNASLVIYEECGFVNGDDFVYGVNSVLGPQLLRSKGREIFVSSPSEDPEHPLHTIVYNECLGIGSAFRFTVFDSPSISSEMVDEAIRRCGGKDTDAFKREYLAQIIRPKDLMVVPFDRTRHVAPFGFPLKSNWTITVDWGGVRDKTVALVHTYDFTNNKYLIYDEAVFDANTTTEQIIAGIIELRKRFNIPIEQVYADVPGQLQIDLENIYNFPVVLPLKTDWLASVNTMAALFSTNKIQIHPKCEFLIKSCQGGMFNKNRTDFHRSQDLGHCDALAALMYGIRSQDKTNPYEVDTEKVFYDNMYVPVSNTKSQLNDIVVNNINHEIKRFGKFK
jgi:hypothetical protein